MDLNQGVLSIPGPNLVILAWMRDELSCGQASDWYTHTRTYRPTDAGDDNTRRPKLASGKNSSNISIATTPLQFLLRGGIFFPPSPTQVWYPSRHTYLSPCMQTISKPGAPITHLPQGSTPTILTPIFAEGGILKSNHFPSQRRHGLTIKLDRTWRKALEIYLLFPRQHLLPCVLQIMPRNPKYDQFH